MTPADEKTRRRVDAWTLAIAAWHCSAKQQQRSTIWTKNSEYLEHVGRLVFKEAGIKDSAEITNQPGFDTRLVPDNDSLVFQHGLWCMLDKFCPSSDTVDNKAFDKFMKIAKKIFDKLASNKNKDDVKQLTNRTMLGANPNLKARRLPSVASGLIVSSFVEGIWEQLGGDFGDDDEDNDQEVSEQSSSDEDDGSSQGSIVSINDESQQPSDSGLEDSESARDTSDSSDEESVQPPEPKKDKNKRQPSQEKKKQKEEEAQKQERKIQRQNSKKKKEKENTKRNADSTHKKKKKEEENKKSNAAKLEAMKRILEKLDEFEKKTQVTSPAKKRKRQRSTED